MDPNWHPALYTALSDSQAKTVHSVYDFVQDFFRNPKFDASHDFSHVRRVTRQAISIFEKEAVCNPQLDVFVVILGALLHDVEDKKYLDVGTDREEVSPTRGVLLRCGMSEDFAWKVKLLVEGVSFSSEVKNPLHVKEIIRQIPELAVVQDADRLDAMGAIGIGRCFTFGGAKGGRSLEGTVQHFDDKLVKLEGMMKTETGKELAAERSTRLREFMRWWRDEMAA